MAYNEITAHEFYTQQYMKLKEEYPLVEYVVEDADWKIGKEHTTFPIAYEIGDIKVRVYRSDEEVVPFLPIFEIAYYYSLKDGLIHLLGIRPIIDEEK